MYCSDGSIKVSLEIYYSVSHKTVTGSDDNLLAQVKSFLQTAPTSLPIIVGSIVVYRKYMLVLFMVLFYNSANRANSIAEIVQLTITVIFKILVKKTDSSPASSSSTAGEYFASYTFSVIYLYNFT